MKTRPFITFAAFLVLSSAIGGAAKKGSGAAAAKGENTGSGRAALWRYPTDISSRNLFFGPGGKKHEPPNKVSFLKEDLDGSNPKFVVQDEDGVKWKVKLGVEARPETVASRLVWAVGYFANEDYFLADLRIRDMPAHLHRGQKLIEPDGFVHNVRLKRYLNGEEKIRTWRWRQDPFSGTRELNGLRVIMALINNWDLKDSNNAIYEDEDGGIVGGPEQIYVVSDLGASFGTTGLSRTHEKSKGNLDSYRHSVFIRNVTSYYVDFAVPSRPALVVLVNPKEFFSRLRLRWIGQRVPRADVKWMGQLLARLSPNQIRDAFRAAGYSPSDVEGFAGIVEDRIARLNDL
jgi:hypothetical protein